uniref:Iron-sulfur cluster co-chaperone protein HscB, mitochondrial n=1 Tax=Cacopsylla melanoneura TaxID=428564 RepID=A0A8D8PSN1_9HEMI
MFESKELLRNFLVFINLVSLILTVSQGSDSRKNTSNNIERIKCWNCEQSISPNVNICPYCYAPQRPNYKRNYFDLFNLPLTYSVLGDIKFSNKLQRRFLNFQYKVNPELYENNSKQAQDIAREHYEYMRKKFLLLQNPVKRAVYLLSLHNITIGENVTATNETISKTNANWLKRIAFMHNKMMEAIKLPHFEKAKEMIQSVVDKLLLKVNTLFKQGRLDQAKEFVIILRDCDNVKRRLKKKRRLFDSYEELTENYILVEPGLVEQFLNDTKFLQHFKENYEYY